MLEGDLEAAAEAGATALEQGMGLINVLGWSSQQCCITFWRIGKHTPVQKVSTT